MTFARLELLLDDPVLSDTAIPDDVGAITALDPDADVPDGVATAAWMGVRSASDIVPNPVCWRRLAEADDPGLLPPYAQIRLVAFEVESELPGTVKEILVEVVLENDWEVRSEADRGGLATTGRISAPILVQFEKARTYPAACCDRSPVSD